MNRITACLAVASLITLSACTKGSVKGTITDGLDKQPVSELRILAKSEAPDLTCQVFEATTDATGAYSFDALCAGQTYTLSSGDEDRFFTGTQEVSGDEQGVADLTAWKGPDGAGVYILNADGTMESQRTKADVAKAVLFETEQGVRYPTGTPGTWPAVAEGTYLVLIGKDTIANQKMHPLIESPEVKFNPDREGITHFSLGQPWLYIGAKMDEEGAYTEMKTELDSSKVINAEHGERAAQYIPASAVPAGKYAMLTDKAKRTYMFEFGGAPPPAEKEEAPAEEPAAE